MNLFGSLVSTAIIVTGVWGVAMMQIPAESPVNTEQAETAQGSTTNKITVHASTLVEKTKKKLTFKPENTHKGANTATNQIKLVGISRDIKLTNISGLWQSFEMDNPIQNGLKDNPKKVYVYYRNFRSNYQEAEVTIGYDASLFKNPAATTSIINSGYQSLLNKGAHPNSKLLAAWQDIDYQKKVKAVLEIHYLDSSAMPVQSELLVKYY